MATFQFSAKKMKTGDAVKTEVYVGGVSKGFTPDKKDTYLTVETKQNGKFSWYAKKNGSKVDSGESSGGKILIHVE